MERKRIRQLINTVATSLFVLGMLYPRHVKGQDFIPYDPPDPPGASETQRSAYENGDTWPELAEKYNGEEFILPVNVVYADPGLNYREYAGDIVTCDKVYEQQNQEVVKETKRICAAVGITPESNLSPQEELNVFTQSAHDQIEGLNVVETDSESQIRFGLNEVSVGETASCSPGALCLTVTNLIHTDTPYLGYAPAFPGNTQAFVDSYAIYNLHGCAPDVPQGQFEYTLCTGSTTVSDTGSHEVGHVLTLLHTHKESCGAHTIFTDVAPSVAQNYYWGCSLGESTIPVDSCIDTGKQRADPVRNPMSYSHECKPGGTCAGEGKTFTFQQNLWRLEAGGNSLPDIFAGARRSAIIETEFTSSANTESLTLEVRAGDVHHVKMHFLDASGLYIGQLVRIPQSGKNEPSPMGETTTYTKALPSGTQEIWIQFFPGMYAAGGPETFKTYFLQQYVRDSGQFVLKSESTTQSPFPNPDVPPHDYQCTAVPYEYGFLPFVEKTLDSPQFP